MCVVVALNSLVTFSFMSCNKICVADHNDDLCGNRWRSKLYKCSVGGEERGIQCVNRHFHSLTCKVHACIVCCLLGTHTHSTTHIYSHTHIFLSVTHFVQY